MNVNIYISSEINKGGMLLLALLTSIKARPSHILFRESKKRKKEDGKKMGKLYEMLVERKRVVFFLKHRNYSELSQFDF